MGLLYFFESIRTPVGDVFFSLITHLGEETLFILAGLLFFWCVNKMEGYYLLSVGLMGTVINQFLKLMFRVPRPWVKDPNFTIVESARAEATGWSFPSGHTQTSVGIFASVARWHRQKVLRVICIVLCVLVPLSRMYLGVHTPADVGVSVVVALILVFGIYPVIRKGMEKPAAMRVLMLVMTVVAIVFLWFARVCKIPVAGEGDLDNLAHAIKNAHTMLGCILGLWLTYEIENRYIRFDTKAVWWVQVLKLVIGFGLLLAIKAGAKAPLHALIGNTHIADGIRYFLMTAFAGCVWPLTFPLFGKLQKKK